MLPNGWKKVKLGDLVSVASGRNKIRNDMGKYPVYGSTGIIGSCNDFQYSSDSILIARVGANAGFIHRASGLYDVSDNTLVVECGEEYDFAFAYQQLRGINLNQYIFGSGQPLVTGGLLKKIELSLPPLNEQKKIAEMLSVWDKAIEKAEKLIEAKTKLFNQMMDNLIIKNSLNSSWKILTIKEIFDVVNRKNKSGNTNVLTSSAQYGLVNQQEYYKKNIASSDISGYYLLQKGDFAYNRSYSTGYPYGVVKRLDKYESGVLSTLYLCMSLKEQYQSYSNYLVFLFESSYLNNQMALICREGARNHGLLNVSKEDFFNLKIQLPSEKEQERIVSVLQLCSKELGLLKQQLENYKKQKQGLMQKLLTGQWRIK